MKNTDARKLVLSECVEAIDAAIKANLLPKAQRTSQVARARKQLKMLPDSFFVEYTSKAARAKRRPFNVRVAEAFKPGYGIVNEEDKVRATKEYLMKNAAPEDTARSHFIDRMLSASVTSAERTDYLERLVAANMDMPVRKLERIVKRDAFFYGPIPARFAAKVSEIKTKLRESSKP